jgi:hypothetical protein
MTNATPQQTLEVIKSPRIPVRHSSPTSAFSLVLLIALGFLLIYVDTPPRAIPATGPAGRFSAERAIKDVQAISKAPHPVGSAEHTVVKQYILDALSATGLSPEVQASTAVSATGPVAASVENIVARLPGSGGGKSVLLVAHYDSVPTSFGASDDGASVAVLLETARMLKALPQMKHDVTFLFSDGEELGLLGAQAFVAENPLAANVGLVLNFEARGTSGPAILFETSDRNAKLINAVSSTVRAPVANSLSYEIYKRLPNDTDFSVFKRAGYPGLNFAFIDGLVHYHTLMDNLQNLDHGSLQQQGDYALELTRHFAGSDDQSFQVGGNAVYFDILGMKLVRYSSATGTLLLILTGLLLAGALTQAYRKKLITPKKVILSLGAILLGIIGAAITSFVLQYVVALLGPRSSAVLSGEFYNSGVYVCSFGMAALATALLLYTIAARRLGSHNLAMAGLSLWFIFLLAISVFAPGGTFLLLWPALVVLVAWNVKLYRSGSEGSAILLNLASAAALILVVPLLHKIFTAFDLGSHVLISIMLALLAALCVHQLTPSVSKRAWLLPGGLYAFSAVLLFGAMTFSPRFDRQHPRLDSLMYVSNADSGTQVWASYDRQPDQWTSQVFRGAVKRATLSQALPANSRIFMQAPAPSASVAPPELNVLDNKVAGAERQVHLQILSPRHASAALLFVPSEIPVLSASLNGHELHASKTIQGAWTLQYFGMRSEGIDLRLRLKSGGAFKLQVTDVADGLPESATSQISPRPASASPLPVRFNDSTLETKTFSIQ